MAEGQICRRGRLLYYKSLPTDHMSLRECHSWFLSLDQDY